MKLDEIVKTARRLSDRYKVDSGKSFRLKDINPADIGDFKKGDKERTEEDLALGIKAMTELQDRLYANDSWALLLVFQAMDAAGKDSAIKHVMSGVNPQGCEVYAFKQPSSEELDHDYLWRCAKLAPRRGHIGIFNRSYYEEVIVVRVHSELLLRQKLPPSLRKKDIWDRRHNEIRQYRRVPCRRTPSWSGSSSSTSRKTNSGGGSSPASRVLRNAGNSHPAISRSASTGGNTCRRTRARSGAPRRKMPPGM